MNRFAHGVEESDPVVEHGPMGRGDIVSVVDELRERIHRLEDDLLLRALESKVADRLHTDLADRIVEMQARLDLATRQSEERGVALTNLREEVIRRHAELARVSAAWRELDLKIEKSMRIRRASLRLLAVAGERRAAALRSRSAWGALFFKRVSRIEGHIDTIENGMVTGWIWDRSRPNLAIRLRARIGDQVIGQTQASVFREDLAALGYGDGHHGFSLTLTLPDKPNRAGISNEIVIEPDQTRSIPLAIFDLTGDEDAWKFVYGIS